MEENLIRKTLSYYYDGGTNGDQKLAAKAFHPSATMKFIKEELMIDIPIGQYLSNFIKAGQIQDRTVDIEYINMEGNAAQVKLIIDYSTHQFIDFFNLLKIDREWLIVSKIFYRKNK